MILGKTWGLVAYRENVPGENAILAVNKYLKYSYITLNTIIGWIEVSVHK